MNPKKELAHNTLLIALSKLSSQLLVFLMLPFYTALLSVEQYGFVDLIVSYGGIITPIILLNLQTALFRFLIDTRQDIATQKSILTNALEVVGYMTTAVIGILLILSLFIEIPYFGVVLFYLLSLLFSDLVIQITRGVGDTKAFAVVSICQVFIGIAVNIILLGIFKMGASGMLLGLGTGFLIPALFLCFYLRIHKNIKLSARNNFVKKELLGYSMPMIPNSIAWWVYNLSDRTIISLFLGVAANGIYGISVKFANILGVFSSIFFQSWSESASINIKKEPSVRTKFFSDIFALNIKVFGSLCLMIVAGVGLFFPWLVNDSFAESYIYIPVLILGALLNTIVSYYSAIYLALKKTRQVMRTSIAGAALNIVVTVGFIGLIDIWAAAIATVVAYGIMAAYRYHDIKKYITIEYEGLGLIRLIASIVFVCTLYYIDNFWLHLFNFGLAVGLAAFMNKSLVISTYRYIRN